MLVEDHFVLMVSGARAGRHVGVDIGFVTGMSWRMVVLFVDCQSEVWNLVITQSSRGHGRVFATAVAVYPCRHG